MDSHHTRTAATMSPTILSPARYPSASGGPDPMVTVARASEKIVRRLEDDEEARSHDLHLFALGPATNVRKVRLRCRCRYELAEVEDARWS